jgi:CRP-like cAMP-binding protein
MNALHGSAFDLSACRLAPSLATPEQRMPPVAAVGAVHNALMSALPGEVVQRLSAHLELVDLPVGKLLCDTGAQMQAVYFPTSAVISASQVMRSGLSAEVALIGREGMVGVPLLLGVATSTLRCSVEGEGLAFKLAIHPLRREMARGGALMRVLLYYAGRHIGQIARTAACHRHGTLEQRVCDRLVQHLDRTAGNVLSITHERIANALGAKRESVTAVAGRLRRDGAIRYHRGRITVLDRSTLEARAGECYERRTRRNELESLALF